MAPSDNVIGGTIAGVANVISGNGRTALVITGAGTDRQHGPGQLHRHRQDRDRRPRQRRQWRGDSRWRRPATRSAERSSGARNVISGNDFQRGDTSSGRGTDNNVVRGNYIGTDKTGSTPISATTFNGVIISNAASNNVDRWFGGRRGQRDFRKRIGNGVVASSGTSDNRIRGNRIGVAAASGAALGNDNAGVTRRAHPATSSVVRRPARVTSLPTTAGAGVRISAGNWELDPPQSHLRQRRPRHRPGESSE